jgi:hypothetical protein
MRFSSRLRGTSISIPEQNRGTVVPEERNGNETRIGISTVRSTGHAHESRHRPQSRNQRHVEIRRNADGSLDEIVGTNVNVHLEQMAKNAWWMGVSGADDSHVIHVNFYSKQRIDAEADDQHAHDG